MNSENKVTESQAQQICMAFLLHRYPTAKVKFDASALETKDGVPSYCVEGELKVRSGTLVAQFLWPPDRYTFRVWVSARGGRILTWEMH